MINSRSQNYRSADKCVGDFGLRLPKQRFQLHLLGLLPIEYIRAIGLYLADILIYSNMARKQPFVFRRVALVSRSQPAAVMQSAGIS